MQPTRTHGVSKTPTFDSIPDSPKVAEETVAALLKKTFGEGVLSRLYAFVFPY